MWYACRCNESLTIVRFLMHAYSHCTISCQCHGLSLEVALLVCVVHAHWCTKPSCCIHPCRVVYLASYADIWVYPFLAKMPPVVMSVFFAGCYVISLLLYFGGMLLSYIRYGSESMRVCQCDKTVAQVLCCV